MDVQSVLSCMPVSDGAYRTDYSDASNRNIIEVLERNFDNAVRITRKAAKLFRGATDRDSGENIWNFLKDQIEYKADGDRNQDVRLPNRLLSDRRGDCKSFALFSAAILANLGIPVRFRYVSFSGSKTPTHVYTMAGRGSNQFIVDAVWNSFDSEKQYRSKQDRIMNVRTLSGIEASGNQTEIMDAIRILQNRLNNLPVESADRAAIYTRIRELKSSLSGIGKKGGVKKFALAVPRNAFLELVRLNVRGIAKHLSISISKDSGKVRSKWEKLGGNFSKLQKAVDAGKGKKPFLGEKKKVNGIGVIAIAAVLLSAAPVLAALAPLLKQLAPQASEDVNNFVDDVKGAGGALIDPSADGSVVDPKDDESKGGFSLKDIPIWAWGAGVLSLSILMRKR